MHNFKIINTVVTMGKSKKLIPYNFRSDRYVRIEGNELILTDESKTLRLSPKEVENVIEQINNTANDTDTVKLSMLIQSHLSDAQIEMPTDPANASLRIAFVKYLIHHYGSDLSKRVDADDLWKQFQLPVKF